MALETSLRDTGIELPPEVWLNVLGDEDLEYFDLKRLQRVNKAFNKLLATSFFDPFLFRSQPPSDLDDDDDEPELHPILESLDIVAEDPRQITIYRVVGRTHVVADLELCRNEMVTNPSSSRVLLRNFGEEALEVLISNPEGQGVTISQLLDAVVNLWGEDSDTVWPEEWEMGDFDGRSPTPRQLSLYEVETQCTSSGYVLVLDEVRDDGTVVLSPMALPSGGRVKMTARGPTSFGYRAQLPPL